jgi:hypothetical protein
MAGGHYPPVRLNKIPPCERIKLDYGIRKRPEK